MHLLFYETTQGGLLHGFCKGTGYQKDQGVIRSLEFSAPSSKEERGTEVELVTPHAYMKKLS